MKINNRTLRLFFAITSLEGVITSGLLYSKRFAGQGGFLQSGFTPITFLVFCLALVITILSIAITVYLSLNQDKIPDPGSVLEDKYILPIVILFSVILIECFQNILFLYSPLSRPDPIIIYYKKILEVILPVMIFGFLLCFQSILLLLFTKSIRKRIFSNEIRIPTQWLIVYLTVLAAWFFIAFTDFGFIERTSDSLIGQIGRFNRLSRPLPGIQVFLMLGFVFAFGYILNRIFDRNDSLRAILKNPVVISLLIGLIALMVWIKVPIEPSYIIYESEISPGTFYPISDGFYFDKEAYRFLAGEGFEDRSTHVFYSFFLSGLHLIGGDRYQDIITLQLVLVAIIPILLYLITRELHTPIAGVFVALLFIIRERNGLLLSNEISGPTVTQYLSENLGLLGMVVVFYLFLIWFKSPGKNCLLPLLIGGLFGISLLIRAEFAAAGLAVAGISLLISKPHNRKPVFIGLLSIAIVTSIVTVPWMARNQYRTGYFSLDKGNFITRRISEFYVNLTADEEESILLPSEEQNLVDKKLSVASVISNHIGNNFTQLFLYLPNNHQPFTGYRKLIDNQFYKGKIGIERLGLPMFSEGDLHRYAKSLPYYWKSWTGEISLTTYLPVSISLLLIIIGTAQVWIKRSSSVIFFLGLISAHIFIWSLARFSGSRYLKPIDWIPLVFFGIGLTEISLEILSQYFYLGKEKWVDAVEYVDSKKLISVPGKVQVYGLWFTVIIVIAIGLGPTLLENRISPLYTEDRFQERIGELSLLNDPNILNDPCLERFKQRDNMDLLYGQALYPRFMRQDQEDGDRRDGKIPLAYGTRVDFYVVGEINNWASLPREDPSVPLVHTDEVILVGEWRKDAKPATSEDNNPYFHVECLYIYDDNEEQTVPGIVACSGPHCMED